MATAKHPMGIALVSRPQQPGKLCWGCAVRGKGSHMCMEVNATADDGTMCNNRVWVPATEHDALLLAALNALERG